MEKILIIDDSPVQAAQLKYILDADYEVNSVQTAEEGFSCAKSGDYSLILLDVVMPGMDGFMLLRKLQDEAATRHIPVILITSLSEIEDEERGLMLGAVDYIAKPFHPLIIKARVRTHIKLYQYRKQAEDQSLTDQLTGVFNRRRHDSYSLLKWQEALRLRLPISVCMFDIDNFKAYNDSFGHPAGDVVISSVAQTISSHFRRGSDFFARYGGEEFVAILMGTNAASTFSYLKKIRQAVEDLHIPHSPSIGPWVTISIGGVTVVPQVKTTYDSCLKIADTMLYDAKRFGRNMVVWADETMKQWREK